MPSTISKKHRQTVHSWSYEGRSATRPNYLIRKVFVKHKQGNLIEANKYIKQVVSLSNDLEYVALLRTNVDSENLAIVNSSLNIEGMTSNLFE